jgi:hypothetical protein
MGKILYGPQKERARPGISSRTEPDTNDRKIFRQQREDLN